MKIYRQLRESARIGIGPLRCPNPLHFSLSRFPRYLFCAALAPLTLLVAVARTEAGTVQVTITYGQGFAPANVTIFQGDTVEWHWVSGRHSTTSGTPGSPNGIWDSGVQNTGSGYVFPHTFNDVGTFPYFCTLHTTETGTVTVLAPKWPVGYFSLTDNNSKSITGDPLLDSDIIDGFRLRLNWTDIQPDTGDPSHDSTYFDWTIVDSAVTAAKAKGKKLGISISAGRYCPDWLYALGADSFTLDESDNSHPGAGSVIPLPWESTFLSYWLSFINAFGARYDYEPTIQYVISTGHQQVNENRFVPSNDESFTFPNAGTTSNPPGLGPHGKLVAPGANFLRTDYSGTGNANIIGKTISDPTQSTFKGGTVVCGPPDCPTPTNDTVYLSKTVWATGGGKTFIVEKWYIDHGDTYKMEAIARDIYMYDDVSHAGTPGDLPPYDTPGYALPRAYIQGTETIMNAWVAALPHTPIILTYAVPFDDWSPWYQVTAYEVRDHLKLNALGGMMTASLFAICPEDYCTSCIQAQPNPRGDQAIYPLNNSDVYHDTCALGLPPYAQRIHDLCEGALEHGGTYLEPYYPDAATTDPVAHQAWVDERPRFDANKP